jgi:signal transduction histidine kinase
MSELRLSSGDAPESVLSAQFLHDLRTPLNQIIGYSDMLTEQVKEEGQLGLLEDLEKIHAAGHQLLALLSRRAPSLPDAQHENGKPSVSATPAPSGLHTEATLLAVNDAEATLLVVDDIEANRDVLSRRLERQGHHVFMASNGYLAMEAVRSRSFDVILLDIMMPEMDGYEVLQQLKADESLRHIPVIMISALDELDSVVRCIEMGAEDYLPKPFNPILLKARIGACLEKKRLRDREMRLFRELKQNHKRLQELEELRDNLTHMIIHDLRTPLNSVMVGLQTLQVAGALNDMQREIMSIALRGGEMLLDMISELLDVDKMESGSVELDYKVLSASDLVASVVSQVAFLSERKSITLAQQTSSDLPPLRGDENMLRRTLVNLVGNAIKFTPAGGAVTIGVSEGEDCQSLEFSVSDTGQGIAAEAFERIFQKFGQAGLPADGQIRSTGLGLTFCKLVVEAHGGHIEVTSHLEQGSKFRFTIPLCR